MSGVDLLRYSLQGITHRKLRSWLTIVSIMTGIAAIYVLISFGQGVSSFVDDVAEHMGRDKLIIQPRGAGFGPSPDSNVILDEDDLEFVRDVHGIDEATGIYVGSGEVTFQKKSKFAAVFGFDVEEHRELVEELHGLDLAVGESLQGDEMDKAIMGRSYTFDKKIFSQAMNVRDKFLLNAREINVVGFYEEVGNPIDDANVYLTLDAYRDLFDPDTYQFLIARTSSGFDPPDLAEALAEKLRRHRDQTTGNQDFQVQTFEQVIETFASIITMINVVLVLIALISVVVAGVNIMNTMYTSVLERTREIGVMKAIGAQRHHILAIFLIEAGLIGALGGVFGVGVGHWISMKAATLVAGAGYASLVPAYSAWLVVGCILFASLVGVLSGFLPARRAASLNAVDALRYE